MRGSGSLDPYVKDFPPGMQDTLYGRPMCLKGQLGPICLFPEYLSMQQIKSIYDLGKFKQHKIIGFYTINNNYFRPELFFT